MELIVLTQAQRELKDAPRDVVEDIFALFDDLAAGKHLRCRSLGRFHQLLRGRMNCDCLGDPVSFAYFM
jgi:hypothetical protein